MVKGTGGKTLYDAVITRINQYTNGYLLPLYSYSKSRDVLRKAYGVEPVEYDICSKGCKMFNDDDDSEDCHHCSTPRYKSGTRIAHQVMIYLPLKEQLAIFVSNVHIQELLKYRADWESLDIMRDCFDGGLYKDIKDKFQNKMDIALSLYTDDFQVYKRVKHTMTIVHFVILNPPEEVRYEDHNMIQVCIPPRPNKATDLNSFLGPVMRELNDLCEEGMIIRTDSGIYQNHRMTFPPIIKKKAQQQIEDQPAGNDSSNCTANQQDNRLKPIIRLSHTYEKSDINVGQKYKCQFSELPTFHGATFFPIDIMHLLGLGIGKQLWSIIQGTYVAETCPLYLSNAEQELIGTRIASSRSLTPSSFSGDYGDISFQSGFYCAVDWIHFVLYIVPTIILEFFTDEKTRKALIDLSNIYRYGFSREIDHDEISCLRSAVKCWINWLNEQVHNGKMSASVFTINQHYLTHMCKTIERDGPLPYLAAFNMERAIGELKKRIRSKRHRGKNAGNVLIELAAIRKWKREESIDINNDNDNDDNGYDGNGNELADVTPVKRKKMDVIVLDDDPNSPEIWSPFAEGTIRSLRCGECLRHFWAWHNGSYQGVTIDPNEIIETGSRLYNKDKNTYGGSIRESFVRLHIHVDNGGKRCVVVESSDIIGFAGRTKGKSTREYVYWSQKTPHSKKELPIDYDLEFIPQ
ncbi:hypothetical protein INT45_009563 [Circinella minor]|uniref:Uncharacterized protein n=1 Tax=Circinella minor TaxID=1195481 RepID=A0A8H7VH02_9FUNG|nr:hypothetical protein INT45_009563 [Circinella minor]